MADKRENEFGGPIEEKYRAMLESIVRTLDGLFNGENVQPGEKTTGFVLMVFPYSNRRGRVNYMSNGANRNDVCKMMEEQILRFKFDRDDDGPILQKMAEGIADVYKRHKEQPMLNDDEAAMAAAAMALTIYRKG